MFRFNVFVTTDEVLIKETWFGNQLVGFVKYLWTILRALATCGRTSTTHSSDISLELGRVTTTVT